MARSFGNIGLGCRRVALGYERARLATPSIFLPNGGRSLDGTDILPTQTMSFSRQRLRRVSSLSARDSLLAACGLCRTPALCRSRPVRRYDQPGSTTPSWDMAEPVISAVSGNATTQGLTIEKCGVGLQGAAIRGYRVTISNVEVRSSAAGGASMWIAPLPRSLARVSPRTARWHRHQQSSTRTSRTSGVIATTRSTAMAGSAAGAYATASRAAQRTVSPSRTTPS